ncbi:MAG: WD40/YVTN/BNR-like repeat-containing protein [Bacteroidota bacterium]
MGKILTGIGSAAAVLLLFFSFNSSKYEPRQTVGSDLEKSRTAYLAAQYYFNLRKNAITGDIPLDAMAEAKQAAKEMSGLRAGSLGLTWTEMGPDNVGGRTRCFLIDNQDATGKTLYAGGVNGGLWKSTNGGGTWSLISDQCDNIAAVSICQ